MKGRFFLVITAIQVFLATAFLAVAMSITSGEILFLIGVGYLFVSTVMFFGSSYLILNQKPMEVDPVLATYWVLASLILPGLVAFVFYAMVVALGFM